MGVHRYDYLIFGWELDPKVMELPAYNWELAAAANMIYDSMLGEKVVFGELFATSDCYDGFLSTDVTDEVSRIFAHGYKAAHETEYKKKFEEFSGASLYDWTKQKDARLLLFSIFD